MISVKQRKDNVKSQRGLATYELTANAIHRWKDLAKTNRLIPFLTSKSDGITSKKMAEKFEILRFRIKETGCKIQPAPSELG